MKKNIDRYFRNVHGKERDLKACEIRLRFFKKGDMWEIGNISIDASSNDKIHRRNIYELRNNIDVPPCGKDRDLITCGLRQHFLQLICEKKKDISIYADSIFF